MLFTAGIYALTCYEGEVRTDSMSLSFSFVPVPVIVTSSSPLPSSDLSMEKLSLAVSFDFSDPIGEVPRAPLGLSRSRAYFFRCCMFAY